MSIKVETVVFVNSIKKVPLGIIVEASNGNPEGPPFVKFRLQSTEESKCHIGKRYNLVIEEY